MKYNLIDQSKSVIVSNDSTKQNGEIIRETREEIVEVERYIHLKSTTIFTTRRGKRCNVLLPLTKRMLIK